MNVIVVQDLVKEFGELVAVDHVSFEVKKGELFGLLGPNGAGKTTMINVLTTLIKSTSGYAEVWGHDVSKERDEVRGCIGIVFQDMAVDNRLTGRENLDFHARMYGMSRELRKDRIKVVLDLVELTGRADNQVKTYSSGMIRRLEIARGLMHHPKVLFLDEPTLGLDAQTRRRIWHYIKRLNKKEGVSIMLTTHYMEEADYLCNRVAIMDYGKIVTLDTPKNLKNLIGADIISLEISDMKNFTAIMEGYNWVKEMKKHDGVLTLSVESGDKKIPKIMAIAQKNGVAVESVNLRKPTLEDVFLHFTGRTMREREADVKDIMRRMRWKR